MRHVNRGLAWCAAHRGHPACRFWPFIPTAFGVYGVWRFYQQRNLISAHDRLDAAILVSFAAAFCFVIVAMLIFTERWTWRGLGQVCTYLADALLYGGSGGYWLGWWGRLTKAGIDLVIALLTVGAVLLVVGVLWAIRARWWKRTRLPLVATAERPVATDVILYSGPERRQRERRRGFGPWEPVMSRPVTQVQFLGWLVAVLLALGFVFTTVVADDGPSKQSTDVLNCEDMGNRATAQAVYDADPSDPNHLDGRDQDGKACEGLP